MRYCTICGNETKNPKHDLCRKCYQIIKREKQFSIEELEHNYNKIRTDERLSWNYLDTSNADRKTYKERLQEYK